MVGHRPLEASIGVRVPDRQQTSEALLVVDSKVLNALLSGLERNFDNFLSTKKQNSRVEKIYE